MSKNSNGLPADRAVYLSHQILEMLDVSRRTLYRMMEREEFPKPVMRSHNKYKNLWCAKEVDDWKHKYYDRIKSGELVNRRDMADIFGYTYAWVDNMTRQEAFPEPVFSLSRLNYYDRETVIEYNDSRWKYK